MTHFPRFAKFILVGGLNTLFGFSVFTTILWLSGNHILAVIGGNLLGIAFNYFSTGKLVFANKGLKALPLFATGYGLALIINLIVVDSLVRGGVDAMIAGAVAIPVVIITSYAFNSLVTFRKPS